MNVIRVLLLLMCVYPAVASAQAVTLRPGRYQIVTEGEMAGKKLPKDSETQCATTDDLKVLAKNLMGAEELFEDCVISDFKTGPDRMTIQASCEDVKWTMDVTMTSDSFILTMTSPVNSGMTITRTGTRIGACTP